MNFTALNGMIKNGVKTHSSVILSVLAGAGTLTTAYLASRASFKASAMIREHESVNGVSDDKKQRIKDRTKLVWKCYIPPAISAGTTVACIFGSNRIGVKKALAATAALNATERKFGEYRDKVMEEYGPRKDEAIRDKIATERVLEKPPPSQDILVSGPGVVLCCELFTGRYFTSDMETLRRAQNEVNSKALKHDFATLDDFYHLIGLRPTSTSNILGWKSERLMELEISPILTEDRRPCLAFDYNYTTTL